MKVVEVKTNPLVRSIERAALACGVAVLLTGCPSKNSAPPPGAAAKAPAPVRVAAATEEKMPLEILGTGTTAPIARVEVKAQVSGPVEEVCFEEGGMVETGQILFQIDKRPFEIALQQASAGKDKALAQAEQARAVLNKDRAQIENAQAILSRNEALRAKGMVSPEKLDQTQTDVKSLKAAMAANEANVAALEKAVGVTEAAIAEAKLQLDYCTIRSPIAGKTGEILIKKGNLVRANDVTPMVVINQIAPIYVNVAVSDRYFAALQAYLAKAPIEVLASILGDTGEPARGKVTFVDNKLDSAGKLLIKATFDNADRRLWPGQVVRPVLLLEASAPSVVVPSQAVQPGQSGSYVWVVNSDMKTEMRKVKTGPSLNGMTAVAEGLKPDEKVVIDGQVRVSPDGEVRIIEDAKQPEGIARQ